MPMARTHIDKRSRLVSAAVGLAYKNGVGATSLADIAREAEVPLGNLYSYFKTHDEICEAVGGMELNGQALTNEPLGGTPVPPPARRGATRAAPSRTCTRDTFVFETR